MTFLEVRFSWEKLKEMKENKIDFGQGCLNLLRIVEIDESEIVFI